MVYLSYVYSIFIICYKLGEGWVVLGAFVGGEMGCFGEWILNS